MTPLLFLPCFRSGADWSSRGASPHDAGALEVGERGESREGGGGGGGSESACASRAPSIHVALIGQTVRKAQERKKRKRISERNTPLVPNEQREGVREKASLGEEMGGKGEGDESTPPSISVPSHWWSEKCTCFRRGCCFAVPQRCVFFCFWRWLLISRRRIFVSLRYRRVRVGGTAAATTTQRSRTTSAIEKKKV